MIAWVHLSAVAHFAFGVIILLGAPLLLWASARLATMSFEIPEIDFRIMCLCLGLLGAAASTGVAVVGGNILMLAWTGRGLF